MNTYWLKFTDGSVGFCEGRSEYDVVQIAEKLTGKTVDIEDKFRWQPAQSGSVKRVPYPVKNKPKGFEMIWQFDHPVTGKCPPFCGGNPECIGKTSCPQRYACCE